VDKADDEHLAFSKFLIQKIRVTVPVHQKKTNYVWDAKYFTLNISPKITHNIDMSCLCELIKEEIKFPISMADI